MVWKGRIKLLLGATLVAFAVVPAAPASAQLQITSPDGKMSLKFGIMTQLQAQWLETADGEHTSKDLYFRRLRLLAGGKITDKLSFFLETDSPNLGKAGPDGTKGASDVYIQDFVLTYTFSNELKIDAGMLLPGISHNSNNSAAALLPVDYGPYSFLNSGPTGSRVGRDYGLRARGYLGDNHFEYRLEMLQGARGEDSTMPFRYIGRVVWYPFEADTGLFYTGTTHGKRKIVGVGGSYETQDDYVAYGGDVFVDLPVNDGDGVTFLANYIKYDGGKTFTTLPEQDTLLLEAGYYISSLKLSPFVQWAERDFNVGADQSQYQVGLAYWPRGHNLNFKLGVGKLERDNGPDRTNVQLQMQVFFF